MFRLFAPLFAPLVGLGFVFALIWAVIVTPREASEETAAQFVHEHMQEKPLHLASDGPFGRFDRQHQRHGFLRFRQRRRARRR